MRVILEIQTGTQADRTFELRPGQIAQVGRSGWVDLAVADDPELADIHFLLEHGGSSCLLRDLNSPGGTHHNGTRVVRASLADGDRIRAGRTTFAVRFAVDAPAPPPVGGASPAPPPAERLLQILRGQDEPLFALLDAARDLAVLAHLRGSEEEYRSLYEGQQGEELSLFAPYLVRLPASSPLLEGLVGHGWGRSWGIYLTSRSPFAEVRKHFRRFLMVQTEEGESLYFRFYDPRVLRIYLPECNPEEVQRFFGPVVRFLVEEEDPATLLRFAPGSRGLERSAASLSAPDPAVGVST